MNFPKKLKKMRSTETVGKHDKYYNLGYEDVNENLVVIENNKIIVKKPYLNGEYAWYNSASFTVKKFVAIVGVREGVCMAVAFDEIKNNLSAKGLSIVIWDYEKDEVYFSTFSVDQLTSNVQLVKTQDGNVVIGVDGVVEDPEDSNKRFTFNTWIYKIDANTTLKEKSRTEVWRKRYSSLNHMYMTDLIEDRAGNIVSVFRWESGNLALQNISDIKKSSVTNLAIMSVDKDGNEPNIEFFKELPTYKWGRTHGGKFGLQFQKNVRFSGNSDPLLMQNPKGPGYIICTRMNHGYCRWSTNGKHYNFKDNQGNGMPLDQPVFVYIDEDELKPISFDFIETTHDTENWHKMPKQKYSLAKDYVIRDFVYYAESDSYLLIETDRWFNGKYKQSTYFYEFKINLIKDWRRGTREDSRNYYEK